MNTNICYSNNIRILFEYRIIRSPLIQEMLAHLKIVRSWNGLDVIYLRFCIANKVWENKRNITIYVIKCDDVVMWREPWWPVELLREGLLRAHQWLSVQGEEADKDICLCLAHPASLVIKGSGQNKAKLNQNMAIFAHILFGRKYLSNEVIMMWFCIVCFMYIKYSFLFLFYFEPPQQCFSHLRLH